jgi:hypothetical protein
MSAMLKPKYYRRNRFSATSGDVVLAAAEYSFTIQLPASGTRKGRVYLESASVYASVAANVTQAYNGAAATTTAVTATPLPPNLTTAASAACFGASDVGAGTAAGGITHVPAGGTATIDLGDIALNGAGAAANYTLTFSSLTGTVNVTLYWSER